jgi:hypothetical protein
VRLTPQVRFHLALCEEHLGNLAAALGDYQIAAEEARARRTPEVVAQVAVRVEALKERIPKLMIRRGAGAESASILLDGVTLGAASIGTDLPINPGPHTIEAQARGYRPFARTVDFSERDRKELEVTLQAFPAPPPAPPPPPPLAVPAREELRAVAALPALARPGAGASHSNDLAFVVGGLGVASLVTSGVFFALRSNTLASLSDACANRTCPPESKTTYDRGRTYTVVADVTLGAGIVGVAAAAALYVLGRGRGEPATGSVTLVPWATGYGLQAKGNF